MRNKPIKQWFSILAAATVTLGSIGIPSQTTAAAPANNAIVLEDLDIRELNFNTGWKFLYDEEETLEAGSKNFDDSSWDNVQLPHDFSITQEFSNEYEAESGFLPGGTGWYRKTVIFPSGYNSKTVTLNFDGVYNHAYVYVNGEKLGEHHYGYTNFSFDITDSIICDGKTETVIAVKAVNEYPSSRWYSGSGIYRDVTLTVTDPVHVSLNGTYVTTPNLEDEKDGDVTVQVKTTVQNDANASASAKVRTYIQDEDGNDVSKSIAENDISLSAEGASDLTQELAVPTPNLWDCDNPNLYYVQTEILSGNTVIDTYTTEFGFRYIDYDANTGFYLNGEKVKMKGVCMHHDQGALGAIASEDAIRRQVEILKEMGCNAIRTSHNAPSRIFLEICNELGMLVMDEAYDGWSYHKNGNSQDFGVYWNETLGENNHLIGGSKDTKYYQFCLESFINRDKNDPCNVMWSIGNEINFGVPSPTGQQYVDEYKEYTANMIEWIQAIDSTRPITHGDNQVAGNVNDLRTQVDILLAESGGVVGLNYSPGSYANVHRNYPNWPLVGSETASSINSRGVYYSTGKHTETGNYQNTAYDTNAVSWGQRARAAWLPVISNDYIMGTFIWTGFDYIGEPTDWNGTGPGSVSGDVKAIPNSSYFGIIDTAGFPKDSYYFYTSQWKEDATTLHIVPGCWNEEDLVVSNGKVNVDIYSNAPKVELLLNGTVIGTAERNSITTDAGYEYGMYTTTSNNNEKCTGRNSANTSDSNNMAAQFAVTYEAGTLSAIAYDENGDVISDTVGIKTVKTNSDRGSKLKVTPEKTEIQADGTSLAYINVDILDSNDEFASQADNNIRFTLSGYGKILGVDNGNASTIDKFQQKSVLINERSANIDAFSGKALVIVQSKDVGGDIKLKVESDGMESQTIIIKSVGEVDGGTYLENYDLKTEYTIDMGTKPVFQTAVNGTKSDGSTATATVTWNEVGKDIYNKPGDYWINGMMVCGYEEIAVAARLHVNPVIVVAKHYSTSVLYGTSPFMPTTVSAILSNGDIYGSYPVTWETIPDNSLSEIGDVITVNGSVKISDTMTLPTTMTIRAADYTQGDPKNIAPEYDTLTETCSPVSDSLEAIADGLSDKASALTKDEQGRWRRWTNWNSSLLNSSPTITFTWEDVRTIQEIVLYYFTDDSVTLPKSAEFFAATEEGGEYTRLDVTATDTDTANDNRTSYKLQSEKAVKSLRITLTCQDRTGNETTYVGLTECEIYDNGITYESKNTALLTELTVNNSTVTGFSPDKCNENGYAMEINGKLKDAVIAAKAKDNAAVTIIPADNEGVARVIVESENKSTTNVYAITITSREDIIEQMKLEISAVTADAASKKESDYTKESWNKLQSALKALQTAQQSGTIEEIKTRMKELKTAINNLKKSDSVNTNKDLQDNDPIADASGSYKVKSAAAKTAILVKGKTASKVKVPATVKGSDGNTYKVVEIAKNAFSGSQKNVEIGQNVTKIAKNAFNCKKLSTVTFKGKKLPGMNKSFKKTAKSVTVKVDKKLKKPAKVKTKTLKALKKAGIKKVKLK